MSAKAQQIVGLPFFLVILGVGLVLSVVGAAALARRLREPWLVTFGFCASLALVLAATLTPSPGSVVGPCLTDTARPLGPSGLELLTTARSLNTWMFVPLGVFVGYLAVRRWWFLVVGVACPVLIEAVQRLLPALGRRCQYQDVIDNLWGLLLGALVGLVLGLLMPWFGQRVRR